MKKAYAARYIIFVIILLLPIAAAAVSRGALVKTVETRLYFVDAEMLRLMPVKISIPDSGTRHMARRVLDELIKGRDDNPKIRRLIPKERRCMTVKLYGETAYVDLRGSMADNPPSGRDLEMLTVYSIVNSLTDIDGIKTVRFTINGQTERYYAGHLDMRETFVPDFFV